MTERLGVWVVACGVVVLHATPALADDPPRAPNRLYDVAPDTPTPPPMTSHGVSVRFDYARGPGAETCPDERGVRSAIAAKLGYDPVASAEGTTPIVRVRLVRQGGSFVALAERRDPAGRVTWTRPPLMDIDCRRLVDVLGMVIAIELDPGAAGQAPPAPLPPPSEPPPPEPPPPATANPPPAPAPRPAFRIGARAGVAVGTLSGPAGTFAADIGVGWPVFSIALEGRADLPATTTVDSGVKLRTSSLAASLVPCGHWRWIFGCGVVSVGVLRAAGLVGSHLSNPKEDSGAYVVAGLRGGVEWPIPSMTWLALRASADALVTVHPMTALRSNDGAKVWITSPFAGLFGAGLVLRF